MTQLATSEQSRLQIGMVPCHRCVAVKSSQPAKSESAHMGRETLRSSHPLQKNYSNIADSAKREGHECWANTTRKRNTRDVGESVHTVCAMVSLPSTASRALAMQPALKSTFTPAFSSSRGTYIRQSKTKHLKNKRSLLLVTDPT